MNLNGGNVNSGEVMSIKRWFRLRLKCKNCIHSEGPLYHYDDINVDVYGCTRLNLYDEDARYVQACGPEAKLYESRFRQWLMSIVEKL